MKKHNFIRCGITGLCLEVLFTGFSTLTKKDHRLLGKTSILMFPIYGEAAFLRPLSHLLSKRSTWTRGLIYMCLIFLVEYFWGNELTKHHMCPWNYSNIPWNIHGFIRLDFAPLWFFTGLLFEEMVK